MMKHPLKSKTILSNLIVVAVAVVNTLAESPVIKVDAEIWAVLISTLNIILRFVTETRIGVVKR
jgi:hypothetical protein